MKILITAVVTAFLINAATIQAAESKLVVHEWGTFTSLQDENGEAIGGINTDDEPVPGFVHKVSGMLLLNPTDFPNVFSKGLPNRCHPNVTMRMETPVIYFHPAGAEGAIQSLNVKVKFRGGWLSEFYPLAESKAPGLQNQQAQIGPLYPETVSTLEWNDLKIGGNWPLTNTTDHVWTSPRAVNAASVQAKNGESEKFLFYRGVANLNAPLKVARDKLTDELIFRNGMQPYVSDQPLAIRSLWLVDIQRNGEIAFRSLPGISLPPKPNKFLTRTAARFESRDFSSGNLGKLKSELRAALMAEGLFADEANALLNTWEVSYFKSPGLRVFFMVPREWTDFYLPLDISVPATVNRAMIGRIELVTPEQRNVLQTLAGFSPARITAELGQLGTNSAKYSAAISRNWNDLMAGRKTLASHMPLPRSYQTYLELGRFRNALVLDEEKHRSTPGLTNFISSYRLQALPIPGAPEKSPNAFAQFE